MCVCVGRGQFLSEQNITGSCGQGGPLLTDSMTASGHMETTGHTDMTENIIFKQTTYRSVIMYYFARNLVLTKVKKNIC